MNSTALALPNFIPAFSPPIFSNLFLPGFRPSVPRSVLAFIFLHSHPSIYLHPHYNLFLFCIFHRIALHITFFAVYFVLPWVSSFSSAFFLLVTMPFLWFASLVVLDMHPVCAPNETDVAYFRMRWSYLGHVVACLDILLIILFPACVYPVLYCCCYYCCIVYVLRVPNRSTMFFFFGR